MTGIIEGLLAMDKPALFNYFCENARCHQRVGGDTYAIRIGASSRLLQAADTHDLRKLFMREIGRLRAARARSAR